MFNSSSSTYLQNPKAFAQGLYYPNMSSNPETVPPPSDNTKPFRNYEFATLRDMLSRNGKCFLRLTDHDTLDEIEGKFAQV